MYSESIQYKASASLQYTQFFQHIILLGSVTVVGTCIDGKQTDAPVWIVSTRLFLPTLKVHPLHITRINLHISQYTTWANTRFAPSGPSPAYISTSSSGRTNPSGRTKKTPRKSTDLPFTHYTKGTCTFHKIPPEHTPDSLRQVRHRHGFPRLRQFRHRHTFPRIVVYVSTCMYRNIYMYQERSMNIKSSYSLKKTSGKNNRYV